MDIPFPDNLILEVILVSLLHRLQIPNFSSTFGTLYAAATAVITRLPESKALV
jgi:hypothetical protein